MRSIRLMAVLSFFLAGAVGASPNELLNLSEIEQGVGAPEAVRRGAAVHQLIHLASIYREMPPEVRDLLIRATADPDARLAGLAEQALYLFENREWPSAGEERAPDKARIAEGQRAEFERMREVLVGREPSTAEQRRTAINMLVHLASAVPHLAEESGELLYRLQQDADASVAERAEAALAVREGRVSAPAAQSAEDEAAFSAQLDMLGDASPGIRLLGLEIILERALGEDRRQDPKVIAAFEALLTDSDPRVAHRARFALAGLAGAEHALGNLYVSDTARRR